MNPTDRYQAILGDTDRAGVYHMPPVDPRPLATTAQASGFVVFSVDLSAARNKAELLAAVGKALHFPAWFGHNLDALADCLSDLSWCPAEGYLVLLEHCDGIHGHAEADFVAALQVFAQAAEDWREQGVPFWCFVDMRADGINWLPDMT